jgi:hypothetical protein
MKESDLYPPVREWLQKRGYEIHVEVFGCDLVAVKERMLTAVELKLGLEQHLIEQLRYRSWWADFVIGVVPMSKSVEKLRDANFRRWRYEGYGLCVVENGRVRQLVKPKPQPWDWHRKHAYRVKMLAGRPPAQDHEIAGLPSCPQLREQRKLRVSDP